MTDDDDEHANLLTRFMAGDPAARRDLPAAVTPKLTRIAYRVAPDLADAGLTEDVVSTTFELLMIATCRAFDPARGSAITFMVLIMKRAIEQVRKDGGAAGVKKHVRRIRLLQDVRADDTQARAAVRRHAVAEDPANEICQRIDIDTAASPLEARLLRAIAVLRVEGNISLAAEISGVQRDTLRRQLRAWASSAGVAAA